MKEKLTTLEAAVGRMKPGSTVAVGGSLLRRQPNAIVREMIRRGIKDLTVLTWASTMATDMLAGAGALKRWEGIYVGFFRHGLAPNFRRAVQAGEIDTRDFPESATVARFRAAGMGVGYLPVKGLLGTGMARLNPEQVKEMTCPFTGDRLHGVAAAEADYTIIHGYRADKYGNVQWPIVRDSDDIDQLMAKAAKHLIVTVEQIVPHEEIRRRPALTYIPHSWVESLVEAPFGAHPCACDGFYDEDEPRLKAYLEAARDPAAFGDYLQRHVRGVASHGEYLELFGGEAGLAHLRVKEGDR